MSSPSSKPAIKPLFTREMLNDIEAELAKHGESINLQTRDGKVVEKKVKYPGAARTSPGPNSVNRRDVISFGNERGLARLTAEGKAGEFLSVFNDSTLLHGPDRTVAETRKLLADAIRRFEASAEAAALANLVRTHVIGRDVDKVIVFGPGVLGHTNCGLIGSFWEHAAARVIARAVREVSAVREVRLLTQDPLYTDVCRAVLAEVGVEVLGGLGGAGFALVDDRSVVVAHHPNYPFRELIADLARPVLICMRPQVPVGTAVPAMFADADSARSRRMLEEYSQVRLGVPVQKAFWENTWYVRKED